MEGQKKYTAQQVKEYADLCTQAKQAYANNSLTAEQILLVCKDRVPEEIREIYGLHVDGLLENIRANFDNLAKKATAKPQKRKTILSKLFGSRNQ